MSLSVLAAASGPLAHYFNLAVLIVEVAIALGLVIFVHELGHFVVAKLCGVKCEKFYLGFDIYGLKLARFRWGETEYGIGVLPLGGYVKMLGQEDNPTKAYEEMQRAKEQGAVDAATAETSVYDPRSYLAQSVPKRMAIISAGVVMNLVFAFVLAVIAFRHGVEYQPCIISGLVPGQPAWQADLEVGDEILAIGDVQKPRYSDLQSGVALGNLSEGVHLTIERTNVENGKRRIFETTIFPSRAFRIPMIGIMSPRSMKLYSKRPVGRSTPAAQAKPAFEAGDIIVAAGGKPVRNFAEFAHVLTQEPSAPLAVTVRRVSGAADRPATVSEEAAIAADTNQGPELTMTVAPNPVRQLGIVMQMGPIQAVQAHSPAEKAGLKAGDLLVALDGQAIGDPMRLPERLREKAGQRVTFTIRREGEKTPRDVAVEVREPLIYEWPTLSAVDGLPMTAPAAGIAYTVIHRVQAVEPGGPAEKAGLKPGDEVAAAHFLPPKKTSQGDTDDETSEDGEPDAMKFSAEKPNWPDLMSVLQYVRAGTQVELTLADERTLTLEPVAATDWFNPQRGFNLEPLLAMRRADTFQEAIVLGGRETLDAVLQVYRFLQKLGHQIPATELGGPITIAQVAGSSAARGFSSLLIFLVMLSANLAVLNFLPIPLLDGGHMVFLILEGIRRKPVSEKVVLAFHYVGFLFIVSLMLFVMFLDVNRLLH